MSPLVSGATPFDQMTAALASAFARVVGLLLTFWTGVGAGTGPSSAGTGIAQRLAEYTSPLTVAAATIGVIVAGTRMAVASSRAYEPARDLLRGLLALAFVWWGGAYLVRVLDDAFDAAGRHVLAGAGVGVTSPGDLEATLRPLAASDPGLVFLLCLVGALSALAQFLLLLAREPALALLAGALPVAAGASVSGWGTVQLRRLVAWTAALTAYKFVAAVVYAAAFAAIGTAGDLGGVVSGIALVIVGVAALPAMVRLFAPAVDAVAAGGSRDGALPDGPAAGAVLLTGSRRRTMADGAPSDAGAQVRPGLLAPTGSALPGSSRARRPALPAAPLPAAPLSAPTGRDRGSPDDAEESG